MPRGKIYLSKKQVEDGVAVKPESAYRKISLSNLRSKLGETLSRVQYGKECVLVTNYGKKLAQLIPFPDEE